MSRIKKALVESEESNARIDYQSLQLFGEKHLF